MPEAVETIDKKIMGKLKSFKNRIKSSEIKVAMLMIRGSPQRPAQMPSPMAKNSQSDLFLIGGAQHD